MKAVASIVASMILRCICHPEAGIRSFQIIRDRAARGYVAGQRADHRNLWKSGVKGPAGANRLQHTEYKPHRPYSHAEMALRAATGLLMDGDANEVLIDDREPDPPPEAAVAASSNLPPDADDDDVHCASHHRDGPLSRRAADCLVAD